MNLRARYRALEVLEDLSRLAEEVRLGQLMTHLGLVAEAHFGECLATIEDEELLSVLYQHRTELTRRLHDSLDEEPIRSQVEERLVRSLDQSAREVTEQYWENPRQAVREAAAKRPRDG
jgi:hypothetical protein